MMHHLQHRLFELISVRGLRRFDSLRDLGKMIGETHPQKVKYHLTQLEKTGFIRFDWNSKTVKPVKNHEKNHRAINFFSIPVLGAANCGLATLFVEERPEGVIIVSESMIPRREKLFAVKAVGDSMNRAKVNNRDAIEDGDYVVVDPENRQPSSGDYVLSIINGSTNIKRFYLDLDNQQIVLCSESNKDYSPIFIHESDASAFCINGKVIGIVKTPRFSQ